MSIMKRLFRAVERSSIVVGRTRARHHLLGRGDRFLADNGFSRELLEQGNRAWPWRLDAPAASIAAGPAGEPHLSDSRLAEAVAGLSAMSDAELHDLGVARSNLAATVRHGRPGVDTDAAGREAA